MVSLERVSFGGDKVRECAKSAGKCGDVEGVDEIVNNLSMFDMIENSLIFKLIIII